MKCNGFYPLIEDMKKHKVDKEHYQFKYNGFIFDVILSMVSDYYELLVAIHSVNWGCVLRMNKYLWIEIPWEVYNSLCTVLHLTWKKDHFSSAVFLQLLSENSPKHSSGSGVDYTEIRKFLPYRRVDDADKIYFCGWNDHIKDGRKAHNFDKTEFFFGKRVADYCRNNNISSMWTDLIKDEKKYNDPWKEL